MTSVGIPTDPPETSSVRTATLGTSATVVVAIPVMLIGAFSVLLLEELGIGEAQLGSGVSGFFLCAALGSMLGGRFIEGRNPRSVLRLSLTMCGVALIGMGTVARSWAIAVLALILAGLASGVTHPAVNRVYARHLPTSKQGFLFGVKQAAVPAASMMAGFAVPIFAGVGWRWSFIAAGAVALGLALTVPSFPRLPDAASDSPKRRLITRPVVLAATGGALASGAANSMAVFFVLFASSLGMDLQEGARLLVIASAFGIVARISAGAAAGRTPLDPFMVVALLVGLGCLGYLTLALVQSTAAVGVGLILGYVAGWGWPGVMLLGAVRTSPSAPAAASGFIQGGTFLGAVVAPPIFGFVASNGSYRSAWFLAAGAAAVGATLIALASMTKSTVPDPAGRRAG